MTGRETQEARTFVSDALQTMVEDGADDDTAKDVLTQFDVQAAELASVRAQLEQRDAEIMAASRQVRREGYTGLADRLAALAAVPAARTPEEKA